MKYCFVGFPKMEDDEKEEAKKDTIEDGLSFREEMFEEYEDRWNTNAKATQRRGDVDVW